MTIYRTGRGSAARTLFLSSLLGSAAMVALPQSAFAACVIAGNNIVCGTTTTIDAIDTNGTDGTATTDRYQSFDGTVTPGAVTASISNGAVIDGAGLVIDTNTNATDITFTNGGSVTQTATGNTGGGIALGLNSQSGGNLSYSDNGAGTITTSNSGIFGLGFSTNGAGTITFNGHDNITGDAGAIITSAANGLTTIDLTGGTFLADNGTGVTASSTGGGITIDQSGSSSIGTLGSAVGNIGISATTSGNGAILVTSDTIFANGDGVDASNTSGGAGAVTITTTGAISAGNGGVFATSNGSGVVTVNVGGDMFAASNDDIIATSTGTGAVAVAVNMNSGNITGNNNGITATTAIGDAGG